MDQEIDYTRLKYVLYARKSTDDPGRQARSIEDQIKECELLAKRLAIKIVRIIPEKKSAKKPGIRPLFRQMLKEIKAGSYDGVIAWHPDRLARNMKEGGEVIDMVDEGHIKDMRFVSHHFSNDANGKMLLGMAFVLSKQYSDKLSQDVTRGVRRKFLEGKSQIPKHGYIRDENGVYKPDGKNFDLICEAWAMKKERKSLYVISDYMNQNNYGRIIKSTGRIVKMTKQILTDVFKDPFYYGVLMQANQQVDLRTIYNFTPAITEEDYIAVQEIIGRKVPPFKRKRITFYPLRMMITCSLCGNHMYAGASKSSSGKRYLFYRCDNKLCSRKKKSVRAKIIFNFISDLLKDGLHFTESDYQKYENDIISLSDDQREKLRIDIHSNQAYLNRVRNEIKTRSLKIIEYGRESVIYRENEAELTRLESQKEELEEKLANLKQQITDPEKDKLSVEQFLNLSKNAANIIQSANAITKDEIIRIIFLNFSVNEEQVLSYQAKEPFAMFLKQHDMSSSRGERT